MMLLSTSLVLLYFAQLAKGLFSGLIYMGGLRKVQDLLRLSAHQKTLSMRFCFFIVQLTAV